MCTAPKSRGGGGAEDGGSFKILADAVTARELFLAGGAAAHAFLANEARSGAAARRPPGGRASWKLEKSIMPIFFQTYFTLLLLNTYRATY